MRNTRHLSGKVWEYLQRDVSIQVVRESFFLWTANGLPRFNLMDAIRAQFLRWAGVKIAYPVLVFAPLEIRPIGAGQRIFIGRDTFINSGVRMTACHPAELHIGERVLIGPRCVFETANHLRKGDGVLVREARPQSIRIENDVWLGANVTVLPGVVVGERSVIAAGAVVAHDVPPGVLVGGVPARVIKPLHPGGAGVKEECPAG